MYSLLRLGIRPYLLCLLLFVIVSHGERSVMFAQSAPTSLSPLTQVTSTFQRFSWAAVAGAPDYTVQIARDAAFTQLATNFTVSSSQLSLGVCHYHAIGTPLWWRVRAGTGAWSAVASVTVQGGSIAAPTPTSPTNGAVATPGTDITVSHSSLPDAEAYIVQANTNADFTGMEVFATSCGGTLLSRTLRTQSLATGTRVYWRVRVSNATGISPWSAVQNFTMGTVSTPPTISGFSPLSGVVGTSVGILGTNFAGATAVRFGGVNATSFTVHNPTQITATVPTGAITGAVSVVTPSGTANSTTFFTVSIPALTSPTLVSPADGSMMTTIPLFQYASVPGATGYDWQIDDESSFATPVFDVNNASSTTTITGYCFPATIERNYWWRVRARNAGSTGPWSSAFRLVASTAAKLATPSITGLQVRSDSVILRWNPVAGATFYFPRINGVSPFCSYAQTSFALPRSSVSFPAEVSVVAYNSTVDSRFETRRYDASGTLLAAPTLAGITPASANAGTSITLTGTNFTGATAVRFGSVNASAFTVVSPTQITATVPAGLEAGTVVVTVVNAIGTSNSLNFTVPVSLPTITAFTPLSGLVGATVMITGTNFTGATAVRFGGVNAASFTVNSATQITATVPSGAPIGVISVVTPSGTANSATNFTVTLPLPTITAFTPLSGLVGATLTITGTNFTGATAVRFGGVNAASFTVNSATQITATVPSGAVTGVISVVTPSGTANSTSNFTVTLPTPTITTLAPTSGVMGATVTITGTNFTGVTAVRFGGVNASVFTVNSATQITATVPSGLAVGTVVVTVVSAAGTSNSRNFSVTVPPSAPTVTSFTPLSALPGASVTITGTNFTGATAVRIGSTPVSSFTVVSATQITAVVPSGISGGLISVVTPAGTASSRTVFAVLRPPPTLTGISPTSGGLGASITISGTNLTGVIGVSFGGVNVSSFIASPDGRTITAVVGAGATGDVRVVTSGGAISLSAAFTFVPAAPMITSISPTSIRARQLSTLTIVGANLNAVSLAVSYESGASLSATRVSNTATQVVFTMNPANAGTARVRLTTIGGSVTAPPVTITAPIPSITGFTPLRGRSGDTITIVGANLEGATSVRLGGTPASIVAGSNTATQVRVVVGAGTSGAVQVVTDGGTASSPSGMVFTFDASSRPPVITGFLPTSGPVGTEVTVTGTNLPTGGLDIGIGGYWGQEIVRNSSTEIVFRAGASAQGQTGRVNVYSPATGTIGSMGNFTCNALTSLPTPVPILPANGAMIISTNIFYSYLDFTWSSVVGATSYTLQFSMNPSFPTGADSPTYTTVSNRLNTFIYHARAGQPPLITYWRVRANHYPAGVVSDWSAPQQVLGMPQLRLLAATPSEAQQGASALITITGQSTDFTRATGVRLTLESTTIVGSIQAGATPSQCRVSFVIPSDAPVGSYTLTVNSAPQDVSLPSSISITSSSGELDAPVTTGFNTLVHGFNFSNSEGNIWPSSAWSSIDYTSAAYPAAIRISGVQPSVFPSFDDYAAIIDLNSGPGTGYLFYTDGSRYPGTSPSVVNTFSVNDWLGIAGDWGGSCDGMSQVALLNYAGVAAYQFSGRPFTLGSTLTNDNLRKLINRHQTYQVGGGGEATVSQTLTQLRTDLASGDPMRHRRIGIFPPAGGVGHSVIPTGITASRNSSGQVIDRIAVYDVNLPGNLSPFIEVNRTLNTWSYPMYGAAWSGTTGFRYSSMVSEVRPFASRPGPIAIAHNDGSQTIAVSFSPSFQSSGKIVTPSVSLVNARGGRIASSGADAESPSIPGAIITRTTGGLPPNFASFVSGFTFPNFQGSEAFKVSYTPVVTDESNRITASGVGGYMTADWTATATSGAQSFQINTQNPTLNLSSPQVLSGVNIAYFLTLPSTPNSPTRKQNILRVGNTTLAANERLQTSVDAASSALTLASGSASSSYDLTLARDTTILTFPRIPMGSNEQHQIRAAAWDNLRASSVILIITKLGANGLPSDESRILELNGNFTATSVQQTTDSPALTTLLLSPNPASDRALLTFTLSAPTLVTIDVVNALGKVVLALPADMHEMGQHSISLNTAALANGWYICRMRTAQGMKSVPMRVVR